MAKRFTDSRKWDDGWFLGLDPAWKLAWIYMLDKCDQAGIYKHAPTLEQCCLGYALNPETMKEIFTDRIDIVDEEKWFIPKFVEFQYGVKEGWIPRNNCEKSAMAKIDALKSKSLPTLKQPLNKGVGVGVGLGNINIPPALEDVALYCKERKNGVDAQTFIDFYDSKAWMIGKNKMKDWRAAVRTWEKNHPAQKDGRYYA